MVPNLPLFILSSSFCFLVTLLIAYQVIRHSNKIRLFILVYSLLTLPAAILNTIEVEGLIDVRINTFTFLSSTLFMVNLHFMMVLDVGYRLRIGEASWKHPLVLGGMGFLCATNVLLIAEIVILAANKSGLEQYPFKSTFIASVICSIFSDSAIFTYTFMPLIYWRKHRFNDSHSRTTALGIWFFVVQNFWYFLYGAVYTWFFVTNSRFYFNTLLAFDYALRFLENLMYAWPPPRQVIHYLSLLLPNSSSQYSHHHRQSVLLERQTDLSEADKKVTEVRSPSVRTYGSKVTIMAK